MTNSNYPVAGLHGYRLELAQTGPVAIQYHAFCLPVSGLAQQNEYSLPK